jgi:hypothetical protein
MIRMHRLMMKQYTSNFTTNSDSLLSSLMVRRRVKLFGYLKKEVFMKPYLRL